MKLKLRKPETNVDQSTESSNGLCWWIAVLGIIALACMTRFYKISEPDHVCWDETHFGKMASWYINRTFFFDVHPPLGKMLIAASGYLTGYNGSFSFSEPGAKFNGTTYLGMRMFCATLGAAVVPFSFVTVWEMTESLHAAILASAFILFDVGVVTLTQYILLDPILLFFVMGSVMGVELLNSSQKGSFSPQWWFWLFFTGVMIGCAISVKFVGLFVILYVGLRTIAQMWEVLGDTTNVLDYSVKHFFARVACLIILPCFLYIGFFYVHLSILNRSGNGDGFYSSAFQSQLIGNGLHEASAVKDVAYGSSISIKSNSISGGYLHSHKHLYPKKIGLRHQQITSYMHKDDNNLWVLQRKGPTNEKSEGELSVDYVRDGDFVRLLHLNSGKYLRVTNESAPITFNHYLVTAFDMDETGNFSDVWRVIHENQDGDNILQTVSSKFKLVHPVQKCALTSTRKQLPKWAYEQHEVTCSANVKERDIFWNVEWNDHPSKSLPRINFKDLKPSFAERFFESHAVMIQGNSGLKPKKGERTSQPWQWPINYQGIHFSEESDNNGRIYLLGNPVIWISNLVLMVVFGISLLWHSIKTQRGHIHATQTSAAQNRLLGASLWLFVGWTLHYLPFWTMQRILYFHHYFTALLFSSMLSGITLVCLLESACEVLPNKHRLAVYNVLFGACFIAVAYSFYLFAPLSYGMGSLSDDPKSSMHNLRWMASWEF